MAVDTTRRMDGPASPFNRTAQHDAKRMAILSQAARLFNHQGTRATTLRDIADSLGLSKTSLYYYVKTKEELVYQCYMAALAHHHDTLDEIESSQKDAFARLSAFILRHFDDWQAAQAGLAPHRAVLLEIPGLQPAHRKEVEARYIDLFRRLRDCLREGIAAATLRPCDPTSTVLAILGSLDWTFSWLHSLGADKVAAAAHQTITVLSHGLSSAGQDYRPLPITHQPIQTMTWQGFNRQEQHRLKQEAFYRTGTWFFNRKGFDGTSLDEIAEHLNVSKGAFYYHIRNKEDLLFNCYERSLAITEMINEEVVSNSTSGLERVAQTCHRMFFLQNCAEGPLIRYNSITALPMDRRKLILARTKRVNERFGEFLTAGVADGSVRAVDTFVAQQLIAGAINASMEIGLWRKTDDMDSAARDYFDVFFNGLLPRDKAPSNSYPENHLVHRPG